VLILFFASPSRVNNSDHEFRNAWIGPPFPLDLDTLPLRSEDLPLQYPSLSELSILPSAKLLKFILEELGYSSVTPPFTPEERRRLGDNIERLLAREKDAARAPPRD
jgi:DOPA 4,5-dioxygenase